MRERLARFAFAAILAAMLTLTSSAAAAEARPATTWSTIFASDSLPAGTWLVGSYDFLYTLHTTWTWPAPGGNTYDNFPLYGPYSVTHAAPMHPGNVLIRLGQIEAATSLGIGHAILPTCTTVTSFNPRQPTRIVVVENSETGVTRAAWNRQMATTRLTAILNPDAIRHFGGITLHLTPIETELTPDSVFNALCQPALLW